MPGISDGLIPSSLLVDCFGRVRRVKATLLRGRFASLDTAPRPEGRQLSRSTGGAGRDLASIGQGRRAISGPLTPVRGGLSRSLADRLTRRSGHVTGPDGTASQADTPTCSGHVELCSRVGRTD
jgi:hypothetical protein